MRDQPELQVPPREIERKFLVVALPENLDSLPHNEILQGYLAIDADGSEVRLRRKGDHLFETVKSAGGLTRAEYEIELTPEQFRTLWTATEGRRVEKTRYDIAHASGVKIELDVYKGKLTGLHTAEVEFASETDSQEFTAPSWFGKEVTDDLRYKNKNLALHGMPSGLTDSD